MYFQRTAERFNTFLPLSLHLLCLQILMNVTLTMLLRKTKGLGASTSATTMWVATSVLAGLATSFRVTTTPAKVNWNFERSEGSREGALQPGRVGEVTGGAVDRAADNTAPQSDLYFLPLHHSGVQQ